MSKGTMTIEGFVANEPTLRQTGNGKSVISITVPHQRSRKVDGGGYENTGETTWAEATFWEEQAEVVAKQVAKGTPVIVTGDPEVQVYDKRGGGQGAKVVLRFPTLGVVPRAPRSGGQQQQSGNQQANDVWSPQGGQYDDESPF